MQILGQTDTVPLKNARS